MKTSMQTCEYFAQHTLLGAWHTQAHHLRISVLFLQTCRREIQSCALTSYKWQRLISVRAPASIPALI